jgi:hypothetical protein
LLFTPKKKPRYKVYGLKQSLQKLEWKISITVIVSVKTKPLIYRLVWKTAAICTNYRDSGSTDENNNYSNSNGAEVLQLFGIVISAIGYFQNTNLQTNGFYF